MVEDHLCQIINKKISTKFCNTGIWNAKGQKEAKDIEDSNGERSGGSHFAGSESLSSVHLDIFGISLNRSVSISLNADKVGEFGEPQKG